MMGHKFQRGDIVMLDRMVDVVERVTADRLAMGSVVCTNFGVVTFKDGARYDIAQETDLRLLRPH